MRLLVYPHDLEIGGSQINAIDLAANVAQAGHDVTVYGVPGPLVDYIEKCGLHFLPADRLRYRPAPSRIAQLATIARKANLDLIHAYEWPPCLDAYFGAGLFRGVPVLCTVLSMAVMPYIPVSIPLIMGTAELGVIARRVQRGDVWVLEPPIDVDQDNPSIDGSGFRSSLNVSSDQLLVVSVSRLAVELKLDALVRAIDAIDVLAGRHAVRLLLVGGGPAHNALKERARAVNQRWGREVVSCPGPSLDPRPAYAAADVVIGMGSSALRALAIGRPVVVQGEGGFSEVFGPDTLELFLRQGFYGLGDSVSGTDRLIDQLDNLFLNPDLRKALGQYGRDMVTERFSLTRATRILLGIYDLVIRNPPRSAFSDALRSAVRALVLEVDNHNPRRKRQLRELEEQMLSAASRGPWPPKRIKSHGF